MLLTPSPATRTVLVLDDDPSTFKGIERIGRASGFGAIQIANALALVAWAAGNPDRITAGDQQYCIVLDTKYADALSDPGIPGEFLKLPRIYISRAGNLAASIACLRLGCDGFLEKPFRISQMRETLEGLFSAMRPSPHEPAGGFASAYAKLTRREREVFDLVASGMPNKNISEQLGIALRTVKVHRANLMRKLGVKSLVELVRAHDLIHGAPQATSLKFP